MYVKIGQTDYTEISELSFAPQTDVTGSSVPVNQFTVSVHTDDQISAGSRASLYDDLDNLWAKYWVVSAERIDVHTVAVKAQSAVKQLERDMLDPVMYDNESADTVIDALLGRLNGEYTLDSSLASKPVSGFCPKQTARNRFQWVCLAIGAYVKDFFGDELEILPVDDSIADVIQPSDTYWKPSLSYEDYVTGVRVYYYTYTEQEPTVTESWVECDGVHYVQTETQLTLRNHNVPENALEHIITVQGVNIINSSNASEVASNMAKYYFDRSRVSLDAINNFKYIPGQRLAFCIDSEEMRAGYLVSCTFSFGMQAKGAMEFNPTESVDSAPLVITYVFENAIVGTRRYMFPVGYGFEVENPYIDTWLGMTRYVLRPHSDTETGTMTSGGIERTVDMYEALVYERGELRVVSVDGYDIADDIMRIR